MTLNQVDENGRNEPWEVWVNPIHVVLAEAYSYYVDPHPGPSSKAKRKMATGTRLHLLRQTIVVQERFGPVMSELNRE